MPDRPSRVVCVAYSGGRDSTALLHATARAAMGEPGVQVVALHVHHGLSAQADAWLAHAQLVCGRWAAQGLPVSLMHQRVVLDATQGESIEALARRARYAALAEMAQEAGAELILLAHHQRDQAETLLLQALRGAGVAGLAGMPADTWRGGLRWVRPWLTRPRELVEAYVAQHALPFIDDDSNANVRFARNRLRHEVWPALTAAFPQAEAALAAAASRVADVLPGVAAWRESLLAPLLCSDGAAPASEWLEPAVAASAQVARALDARLWAELDGGARREALAHWYRQQAGKSLPASWTERLAHEVPGMAYRQQAARWAPVGISLYRGVLTWQPAPVGATRRAAGSDQLATCEPRPEQVLRITAPGSWPLPQWGGTLHVAAVESGGVRPDVLADITLRARQGAEQFQLGAGRPARSLKKQFQAMGVPAWHRDGPLLYTRAGQLVFVPGLGVDARCLAPAGSLQWGVSWVPALSS
jgi:tRNA(Ile)-lysidine synthase